MIARGHLNTIQDRAKLVPVFINFSAQTNSQSTQVMIESKLEKKRKNILGMINYTVMYIKFNLFFACPMW